MIDNFTIFEGAVSPFPLDLALIVFKFLYNQEDILVSYSKLYCPSPSNDVDIVYRCKVKDRKIASTWKDLGDYLAKDDQILRLWLSHKDYDLENFKKSAKVKVIRFGI